MLTDAEKRLLTCIMNVMEPMVDHCGDSFVNAFEGEEIPEEWEDEDDGWWIKSLFVLREKLEKLDLVNKRE